MGSMTTVICVVQGHTGVIEAEWVWLGSRLALNYIRLGF